MRPKKTSIVRKRTGCQRCRNRRRQCDETQPECNACVRSGVRCGGYQNRIRFKDVSDQAAEASRKGEAARRLALEHNESAQKAPLSRPSTDHEQSALVSTQDSDETGMIPEQSETVDDAANPMTDSHMGFILDPYRDFTDEDVSLAHGPILSPVLGSLAYARASANSTGSTNMLYSDSSTPAAPRRWLPEQSLADHQNSLALVDLPKADELSCSWEDLLQLSQTSRASTPRQIAAPSISSNRDQHSDPMSEKTLLSIFESEIAPHISLGIGCSALFAASSGFRAAALALSTIKCCGVGRSGGDSATNDIHNLEERPSHYYDFAVADLSYKVKAAEQDSIDSVVATAILLIYHDRIIGSHRDICHHLRQLEALSSHVNLPGCCTPGLLRAWHRVTFEMRIRALPTRKSITGSATLSHVSTAWDSRVTIRDIFSSLWKLHARAITEASFQEDQTQSASKRAAQWLCSVLGRRCDRQQLEQQDYYDQSLSATSILSQCATFEERLDAWHRAVPYADLPVPALGRGADEMLCGGTFGAIVPHRIVDRNKGSDYLLYILSRLICLYLVSTYQIWDKNSHKSTFASEAMSRFGLGIILGLGVNNPPGLDEPGILSVAHLVVLLSDGIAMSHAVLEGLLPTLRKSAQDASSSQLREIAFVERLIQIVVRERYNGRSIRLMISGTDEDERHMKPADRLAVFGDISGRGYFRDVCEFANRFTAIV